MRALAVAREVVRACGGTGPGRESTGWSDGTPVRRPRQGILILPIRRPKRSTSVAAPGSKGRAAVRELAWTYPAQLPMIAA